MKRVTILFLFLLLAISCDKQDTEFPSGFYAPTIHGYIVTDESGNEIKVVGVDDTKVSDQELNDFHVHLLLYPNPCSEFIYMEMGTSGLMKKIWIVPAEPSNNLRSFMTANFFAVCGYPVITMETNADNVWFDLSKFDFNLFRVYVSINGILLWNNIVKQSN